LAFIKAALSTLGSALPTVFRLRAERQAGQDPHSATADCAEQLLNGALGRLGAITPEDPFWKTVAFRAGGAVTRPDEFRKPHVRDWLSRSDVRAALKALATAQASGAPEEAAAFRLLIETYMELSGEDERHARGVVDTALAYLRTALQSAATDAGTAGLVQAGVKSLHQRIATIGDDLGSVRQDLAKLAAQPALLVDDVLADHHGTDAKKILEGILRRRASPMQNTLHELKQLALELSDRGKFRAAPAAVKAEVISWIGRLAAADGDIAEAQRALDDLTGLGVSDTAIISAWLDVARGQPDIALQRLRDSDDADKRTVLLAILRQSKGLDAAQTFYEGLGEHPHSQFTAIGWQNVVASLLEAGRLDDAVDLLSSLPEDFFWDCPFLGYVKGVVYCTQFVPAAYRKRILDAEFLAVTEHLLEGEEASRWRRRAADAFTHAKRAADAVDDRTLAEMICGWLRWLRLIDPAHRDQELAALKAGMEDGATAAELIVFAGAVGVTFDPLPLEKYLARQEALGGLSRRELDAKLHLLRFTRRHSELVRFIEGNWDRLADGPHPGALGGLLIETLVRSGECGRAENVLISRRDQLHAPDIPRFQLMIDHCRGEDPTKRALENYKATRTIEDLWNLVTGLTAVKRWSELTPYALALFEEEPTGENALRYIECLHRTNAPEEEIVAFLDRCPELVAINQNLKAARAWALFHLGEVEEARRLNDQLLATRRQVNDVALDINIAMRAGEWERFTDILAREWDHRSELPPNLLLHLANLAGVRAPERAIQLAQEAVNRQPDNPHLLLQAHSVAVRLARDDIAMPWINRAAALSKAEEGPVKTYSFREMVEMMKDHADDWRRKNDLFRSGKIPLHWATSLFNIPLSRFLIAIPRENRDQPDARKRVAVPIRSGARRPVDTTGINRLVLDVTSILILSELGFLESVVETLDEVFVSPRVMELLLFERDKVEFHQPSRISATGAGPGGGAARHVG